MCSEEGGHIVSTETRISSETAWLERRGGTEIPKCQFFEAFYYFPDAGNWCIRGETLTEVPPSPPLLSF